MPAQSRPTGRNTPRPSTDTGDTADGRTGPRIGSLFSGAAGLDRAVELAFSGEVIWHAEIDKAASKVLAHHYPNTPNLGDITAVDWADVPAVDVLCGGFPCQDVSAAGKRAGIKDGTRSGLWSVFAAAIDALRPQWVVIENVRGLLSATAHRTVEDDDESGGVESSTAALGNGAGRPVLRAAGAVLGDLADLGYDAQWATVAAADVGAPHRRERVFIVATDASGDGRGWGAERYLEQAAELAASQRDNADRRVLADGRDIRRADAADAPRYGRNEGRAESAGFVGGSDVPVSRDGDVALLPTPNAEVERGSRTPEGIARRIAKGDKQYSLEDAAIMLSANTAARDGGVAFLPTPRVGGRGDCESERRRNSPGLESIAVTNLLPTPNASDCSGGGMHPDSRYNADGLRHSQQLIDAVKLEPQRFWGKYTAAIRRWESIVGSAPAPTEPNKNGNPRLSALFSEWLMGWPAGWVTDPAIGISRNDQLRIVGNGVCPQQAAHALRFLLAVATGTHTHTPGRADVTPTLLPTPCARDHKDGDSAAVHARHTPSLGAVSAYFNTKGSGATG